MNRRPQPARAAAGKDDRAGRRPEPGRAAVKHGGQPPGGQWAALASEWGPVAARILLALVLAWFGYHELVRPDLWTGYVPVLASASSLAVLAVLAHGWLLLVLAVALAAGIASRLAAGVAAALVLEIVVSLTLRAGLSDLVLRDAGVLGLAVCLTGISQRRLVLRR